MNKPNSSRNQPFSHIAWQSGVSLIELMIALAISMVLTAVIGYTYLASSQVFRSIDAASRLQESARFAFETIAADVRMAGFTGCGNGTWSNTVNNSSNWETNLFGQAIRGYEDSINTFPNPSTYPAAIATAVPTPANSVLRGDALTVLRGDTDGEFVVSSHNAPSAQFQLAATHDIKPGEILVVCDENHAAVFQMTGPTNNNNTASNIVHNTGTEIPGNCTKYLGEPSTAGNCGTGTAYEFGTNSRVMRLSANLYFIRTNPHGEPALYRQKLTQSGGNIDTLPEEIVEGVENMQVTYGVDTVFTDSDGNQIDDTKEPTQYVTADQVTAVVPIDGTNIVTAEDQWKQVRTVRISLLMVSRQDENVTTTAQTYTFGGNPPPTPQPTVVPNDRRLRKVFTTVIAVRNRL